MHIPNIPKFNIKDTDYVLDIGGGHVPFERANVIIDKFPEPEHNQSQRGGPIKIPEGVKFIKADAVNMPFKDKEFDFVVCAETLNHIEDPIAACKEIIRVGKRGYIEMPGPVHEIFASNLGHLWICLWDGITLRFVRNHWPENTLVYERVMNRRIQTEAWNIIWNTAMVKCRETVYIEFVWEGNFKYEILK